LEFGNFCQAGEDHRDWILQLYPKGDTEENIEFMSVYLWIGFDVPVRVQCSIGVLNRDGNLMTSKTTDLIIEPNTGTGWSQFISREQLFNKDNGLLENNTLTLAVDIEFTKMVKFATADKSPLESSSKLEQICRNRFFTDLTIKVQDKSIRAHKLLLAENSLILYSKLLLHENQNVLELDDVSFEIAQEMINFIYDGKVQDMEKNVDALLEAAHTNGIVRLKKFCEAYMFEHLSSENVHKTYKLAEQCIADELRMECVDFIAANIKEVMKENWKELILANPSLFNDIFKYCVVKIHQKLPALYAQNAEKMEGGMEFKVNALPGLCQDYEALFTDMLYADVDIVTGTDDKVLQAHKVILSSKFLSLIFFQFSQITTIIFVSHRPLLSFQGDVFERDFGIH
jgi:speckle-type POZ protein